jgi:hypothetical protein
MSDGFPELFNPDREMLDYVRVEAAYAEAASFAPRAVIDHLVRVGDAWAQGRPADDDVTFVVLRLGSAND